MMRTLRRRVGARRSGSVLAAGVVAALAGLWVVPAPGASAVALARVTNCLDNGSAGSLRQVIGQASSGAVITFAQACPATSGPITLSPSLGPIRITKSVAIVGPGAAKLGVSGGRDTRVFQVAAGVTVLMSGVTVEDGAALDGLGGGIDNAGNLALTGCTVTGNQTNGAGGGIDSTGVLAVTASTVSGNSATVAGGGIFNDGGDAAVTATTVSSNTATSGGGGGAGIFSFEGTLAVVGSTVSDNSAPDYGGGGIWGDSATMLVVGSRLSGNTADGGGAIWDDLGSLLLSGSTVTGNTATLAGGGAIYLGGIAQGGGTMTIDGSHLSDNRSTGLPDNTPYAGIYDNPIPPVGTITVHDSTFS